MIDSDVRALVDEGYTFLPLAARDVERRRNLQTAASAFFDLPGPTKMESASADYNSGYRPAGIEYAQSPDRPDLNEAYAYWVQIDPVPNSSNRQLLAAFEDYQRTVQSLAQELIERLGSAFGRSEALPFAGASYIQINRHMTAPDDREFLQDPHEDGHLLTLHYASDNGLEIEVRGQFVAAPRRENNLLVIPGSVLTLMTGGAIDPLYHRVRALSHPHRFAIMYFVNPSIEAEIKPFVENDFNRGVSIRERVASAPEKFGLPNLQKLSLNRG